MPRKKEITILKKADAILAADIHLSPRVPKCREEEEYIKAVFTKLEFIKDLQEQHGNIPVLCSGDVTDRWYLDKGEQWFVTEIIKRMDNWLITQGQHDLPQHSLELHDKSLLALLEWSQNSIKVLNHTRLYVMTKFYSLVAFPWSVEPLPLDGIIKTPIFSKRGVALIHRMVYQGKPPYPEAEKDGGTAKSLLRKMKGFDLIVSGDNHETFVEEHKGRLLVNPGSVMRRNAGQVDHKPCVFLWYAKENRVEQVLLPFTKGVVNRDHLERVQQHDERMLAFVEHLDGGIDLSIGFRENVITYMKENDVRKETQKIVMEVLP